jgi:hypothetical protein
MHFGTAPATRGTVGQVAPGLAGMSGGTRMRMTTIGRERRPAETDGRDRIERGV